MPISTSASPAAISLPSTSPSCCRTRTLRLRAFTPSRTHQKRVSLPACARLIAAAAMPAPEQPKPRVLVAGGGIGGLVFALAARRKGFEVLVLERDMSAVRGEGRYRGPIQLQSNALAVLEAVDAAAADEVMDAGCITGDRVNGIVDGVSGSCYLRHGISFAGGVHLTVPMVFRYIKFDTFTPAAERGLPVTRVISRMTLQQILARAVGDDAILNESHVVDFVDDGNKVTAILEDGRRFEGDILVGADGIWSKVRKTLFGHTDATYSGYTCYTGIADFVPPDIDTVGYRVFLGHKQYFVSSDVGGGKMQWYAFHKEAAGGTDPENGKKKRLLEIFSGWCDNVIDLINATEEEAILRRDIYDRPPTMNWGKGRVTLLGDSVHAMQPNLGQGGCMAIEDGYQLAVELDNAWQESVKSGTPMDIVSSLKRYEKERRLRVAIIHGLARMAAIMATTYRPYLGVGLGPLSANDQLPQWFQDDDALEGAMGGEWYLFPTGAGNSNGSQPIHLIRDEQKSLSVGRSRSDPSNSASSLTLPLPQVSETHATITCKNKAFYVTDLGSEHGRHYRVPPNFPVRFHPSDVIEFGSDQKAVFRVKVLNTLPYESARRKGEQQQQVLQAA
ncbi:hypothetical protein PR202_ga20163 [Eleusine coracana subsp. coracana]|uniref:Zeaxanthin epoxidase, chloroplastic n=1 Tax=Eleusine coracana subsp. coracana TaxID=191504 RepID=A0AAV5CXF5_ELECO|nr:hypothetical protein PR202_ga20163 [Eleusine coracana subsp. coracana]